MESLIYEPNNAVNLGIIIRSAVALGVERIHVYDSKNLLSVGSKSLKKVKGVSTGAYSLIDINVMGNLDEVNTLFEEHESRKIATVCKFGDSMNLQDFVCQNDDLVLFGNERNGLPGDILDRESVEKLTIPMQRNFNSLNLACTFTLIAYEYMRQNPGLIEN